MKCPICGTRRKRNAAHCPDCGAGYAMIDRFESRDSTASSPIGFLIARGIAIAAACALLGCGVYLSFSFLFSPIDAPGSVQEHTPVQSPAEGCFAIDGGALTFLPDRWDGGPVLTIPDTVDGQSVTALASGCFRDCTGLTTIILPEKLTAIGPDAFSGCDRLRGLYLPEGMRTIGEDAFAGCVALEAICIPATVTAIAEGSFDDCASLLYINYGGSFQEWAALYDDFITPFTAAICIDGSYYHGVPD